MSRIAVAEVELHSHLLEAVDTLDNSGVEMLHSVEKRTHLCVFDM